MFQLSIERPHSVGINGTKSKLMTAISFSTQMNYYRLPGMPPHKRHDARAFAQEFPQEERMERKEAPKADKGDLGKHVDISA